MVSLVFCLHHPWPSLHRHFSFITKYIESKVSMEDTKASLKNIFTSKKKKSSNFSQSFNEGHHRQQCFGGESLANFGVQHFRMTSLAIRVVFLNIGFRVFHNKAISPPRASFSLSPAQLCPQPHYP